MPVGWSLTGWWSGLHAAMMLLLLLLGARSAEARVALMTQSYTTAIQFTDWTNSVTSRRFDPRAGTMAAVRFQIVGKARGISRVEKLS